MPAFAVDGAGAFAAPFPRIERYLSLYNSLSADHIGLRKDSKMRAETERTVAEIKQAIALLRRHL